MTIAEKKYALIREIMLTEDEAIINRLSKFFHEFRNQQPFEDYADLPGKVKKSIAISEKQFDRGEGITLDEAQKKFGR